MKLVTGLFALALGLSLGGSTAFAAATKVEGKTVVSAPDWVLGSTWYYSDGYALKVSSTVPGSTVFDRLDAPGQWFSRQGFLRKDLTSATATRTSIFRTIPDQSGLSLRADSPLTFQREYLENGSLKVHASSWSVEGRETITVPSGTFDCWIIVWRSRSLQSDWTGFERWWYSPQVQNYVRMEYKYGPDSVGSRVLMRYQIGAQRAENIPPAPVPLVSPLLVAPAKIAALEINPLPPAVILPEQAPSPPAPIPASAAKRSASPVSPPKQRTVNRQAIAEKQSARAPRPTAKSVLVPVHNANAAPQSVVWHAQIASSKEETAVRKSLAKTLHALTDTLQGIPSGVSPAQIADRGVFYRAWLGEYDRAADAVALCGAIKAKGAPCSVSKSVRDESRSG